MKKLVLLTALLVYNLQVAYSLQLYYLRPVVAEINLHIGYPYYSTTIAENLFLNSLNIRENNLNILTKESFHSNPYYQFESICRLNWHSLTGLGLKGNYTNSTMRIEGNRTTQNGLEKYEASQFISCEQYGTFVEFALNDQRNNPFIFLLGGLGYQHSYRRFIEKYSPNTQLERTRQESEINDCVYFEPGVRLYYWTKNFGIGAHFSYNVGLENSSKMNWNGPRAGLFFNILLFDRYEDHSYNDSIEL